MTVHQQHVGKHLVQHGYSTVPCSRGENCTSCCAAPAFVPGCWGIANPLAMPGSCKSIQDSGCKQLAWQLLMAVVQALARRVLWQSREYACIWLSLRSHTGRIYLHTCHTRQKLDRERCPAGVCLGRSCASDAYRGGVLCKPVCGGVVPVMPVVATTARIQTAASLAQKCNCSYWHTGSQLDYFADRMTTSGVSVRLSISCHSHAAWPLMKQHVLQICNHPVSNIWSFVTI